MITTSCVAGCYLSNREDRGWYPGYGVVENINDGQRPKCLVWRQVMVMTRQDVGGVDGQGHLQGIRSIRGRIHYPQLQAFSCQCEPGQKHKQSGI